MMQGRHIGALIAIGSISSVFAFSALAQSVPAPIGDGPTWGWVAVFAIMLLTLALTAFWGFVLKVTWERVDELKKSHGKRIDALEQSHRENIDELKRDFSELRVVLAEIRGDIKSMITTKGNR
jgi:hypothetical protein